ncbi:hypothetical protein QQ045_020739 [Rhodiola kirilowii]
MLAFTNPRNAICFASFEHLALSAAPIRVSLAVNRRKGMSLRLNLGGLESRGGVLGLYGCGVRNKGSGFIGRCCVNDGDWDLEGEIFEFMKNSRKPAAFPSKKELVEAGRMDLVKGIEREGGWMALGWDLEDEAVGCGGDVMRNWKCDTVLENGSAGLKSESSQAGSSSADSLGVYTEEATGIEGILNRLEKERSTAFDFTLKEREFFDHAVKDDGENIRGVPPLGSPSAATVAGHDRSSHNGIANFLANSSQDSVSSDFGDSVSNISPDKWQTWSKQRASTLDHAFEAADISFNRKSDVELADVSGDKLLDTREGTCETLEEKTDSSIDHFIPDFIRTRLQNLELELSAILQSLKSRSGESTLLKAREDLSEEMWNVSDAWEFQQTEIMHAKDRLRSLRAKIAVLEGRISMTIMYVW